MNSQPKLFKDTSFSKGYGGVLLKTRKGRSYGRPLDTQNSMHLVLRSTQAKGDWSFKKPLNEAKISQIVSKFAFINGIKVISMANVGNHLHLHIKLSNRFRFKPFIRAMTASIAMAVTGRNRWTSSKRNGEPKDKIKFWDYRPFTRIVKSYRAFLNLKDYIQINIIEGFGSTKIEARMIWDQINRRALRSG